MADSASSDIVPLKSTISLRKSQKNKTPEKSGGSSAVCGPLNVGFFVSEDISTIKTTIKRNEHAPVRRCLRYIANRPGQFNYHDAIAAGLPIGSGEVESAHRYVIQDRIKLPGAWWRLDNAEGMLKLRVLRANYLWNDYGAQRADA